MAMVKVFLGKLVIFSYLKNLTTLIVAMFFLGNFIRHMSSSLEGDAGEKVLDSCTPEGFVHYLKSHKCSNVIVMTGAGISTCKT